MNARIDAIFSKDLHLHEREDWYGLSRTVSPSPRHHRRLGTQPASSAIS